MTASTQVVLSIDATTSIKRFNVVNVLALIPDTIVMKTFSPNESKNGEFYRNTYQQEIDVIGEKKVVATINDNEASIVCGQRMLLDKNPHIINITCFAHSLNLFARNGINEIPVVKELIIQVTAAINLIRGSSLLHSKLSNISSGLNQKDGHRPLELQLPGDISPNLDINHILFF